MLQNLVKNHWIVFRRLWTRIHIYTNILNIKNKKVVNDKFKQILNISRPYLIIEKDEDIFLVLTLTKHPKSKEEKETKQEEESEEEEPAFGRFEIKCEHCLNKDTYVILHTKILMSRKFVEFYKLNIWKKNNEVEHNCLESEQFLELLKALDIYWNKQNEQLTIIRLGIGDGKIKEEDRWILP